MQLASIEQGLQDLKAGKFLIVVDDEDRENEGDVVMPAEFITPEAVNFMVTHARGQLCMPMTADRLAELDIPMLPSRHSDSPFPTAFTMPVDYAIDTTTGISAQDRAATIQALIDPDARPEDFIQPGHLFPLRYQTGGVLNRPGHTEAVVDLCQLAGAYPAGVVCEIMNADGTMSRLPELEQFAATHDLKIFSIAQLIAHRRISESLISRVAEANLPTKYGVARIIGYRSSIDSGEHAALVVGDWKAGDEVLVRVHSECLTGDAFGSLKCDCGDQLDLAIRMIFEHGRGALVYLRQEGRGIGLHNKIKAYSLQDQGLDTIEANVALGFQPDERKYDLAVQIMRDLDITHARLVTNNPHKMAGISGLGIQVTDRVSLAVPPNETNEEYMRTKRDSMGHLLSSLQASPPNVSA
ncbi:Riboflavin biosynthesis protein RibBA [Geodia barretti]|uniref:Riboflavin biosynthesis protein RibBA n=1 Tax=Geodia barretti TaxID=519541 RepID=A0AA35SZR4_GEOBA|nr:Riboflavin biosynthesis protein RibBA [Geodia barretti]